MEINLQLPLSRNMTAGGHSPAQVYYRIQINSFQDLSCSDQRHSSDGDGVTAILLLLCMNFHFDI